ncbi:putative l-2-hydroxyglutarate dehydrogenase, mitochondrial-like isoform X2 [Capsicum annuum]|uniref:L-2-hydroxyglutarate dehydrogenase, mitochondrial n=1 Tax=Capsicum annuum TaxID=4072 RepID=A0A2G2Z3M6_CAPAN|nr:putative l-2-hydroxyglutarate dehydrogenase, mitochondrial-like isoform X2 [Capsicum annuum]PHT76608.1 hypothetical protein T459_20130 [Capsicum annuum]
MTRGIQNGVKGLRMMEGYEATTLELELQTMTIPWVMGQLSRTTLLLLVVNIEGNQIQIHAFGSNALAKWNGRTELNSELILIPKFVVNSASLSAPAIAKRIKGQPDSIIPASKYARGCYFTLSNTKSPFKHLIYPIPEVGGLGVHVTLDLNGQVKFGPDVEWIKGIDDIPSFLNMFDYSVHEDRANQFYPAIRKYYPGLKYGSLDPGYVGIRPKLSGPEEGSTDFVVSILSLCYTTLITCNPFEFAKIKHYKVLSPGLSPDLSDKNCRNQFSVISELFQLQNLTVSKTRGLQGEDIHGISGLVNLFGIESPGLTSSMTIAEHVAAKLLK